MATSEIREPAGWVLYDGQCGFCSRWVEFWKPTLAKQRIVIAPLQEVWVAERLKMTQDELLADIHFLTTGGKVASGADAYLQVTRRIWWAWPFYAIFSLPGCNWLIRTGYRWFARNRYCVSHACTLPPQSHNSSKHPGSTTNTPNKI